MIVFYYTDIDNLAEILSMTSRANQRLVLKAIHRCYLNDDLQRTFARYILPSCISSVEEEINVDAQWRVSPMFMQQDFIPYILNTVSTFDDHRVGLESFVLSFSEDQDNSELWNKCGNGGRGVALGFDTDKIKPDHERFVNVRMDKCIYWSDDIKNPGFKLDTASKLYASIRETYKMMIDPRVLDSFKKIYNQEHHDTLASQRIKISLIENLITTFDVFNKQDVWRNEKEYRISLSPLPLDVEYAKDANGDYIPYAEVQFPVDALRMMVIGPRCGKNAYGMVKSLLSHKGISQDVQVLSSALRH